ncbi:ATP-binding cassette domain-containing protein [Acidihalobacter prosperus]|uniref:ABC transporter domain-containing protein n=1 Tax=Acidihalobacter prosperus TaxID=160660 RepID=A0A1A6C3S1_9GAMM|nr:ABC transporter ATP-binding protein [Acidihalobacter prosperus]OBS09212.1 hypothetical protein Thpro_021540 [Acidihalobacter prosperus]
MNAPASLTAQDLRRTYGGREVLRGASLALAAGVYALRGPNGIGKSTLLAALAGAVPLEAGEVRIDGISLASAPLAAKRRLGYAPDESPVYPFVSGRTLLEFVAATKGVRLGEADRETLRALALETRTEIRFSAQSLGMQKKFLLAAAWIGAPRVLLLDEPSNGLDASARDYLCKRFAAERERCVILFTTHDSRFAERAGAASIEMETLFADAR